MSDPNLSTRRQQMLLIGVAIAGIVLLSVIGILFFDRGPATVGDKPKTVNITAPGSIDDKDAWRAQQSAKEKANETQISEIKAMLHQQQDTNTKLTLDLERVKAADAAGREKSVSALPSTVTNQRLLEAPLPPYSQPSSLPPIKLPQTGAKLPPSTILAPPVGLNTPIYNAALVAPARHELEIIRFGDGPAASATTGNERTQVGKTEVIGFPTDERAKRYGITATKNARTDQHPIEFLPAGSFVRVSMLNGVDAPTGGQAQSNPLPLALHVMESANLANKYRLDVRDCRFIAAAWGDLSAERTMARTESLTCIINGESVEMAVKGQVIGEDGKAGIRGRVVTKQGQLLANALFAGSLSGIGRAFQAAATTTTNNAAGVTQIIEPDKVAQAGIGGGVTAAANSLAQYYLRAADKLFPVIETDGGRIVEVLITKGAVFTGSRERRDDTHGLLSQSRVPSRSDDDD
jgi:conjugal transfer pilus assembly protein TraB